MPAAELSAEDGPTQPATWPDWRRERGYLEEPDSELARLSSSGDRIAFDVLIGRYRADLAGLSRRYHWDQHDQDELVQEAMIKAWRKIGQFDARSSVLTWLYRIMANAAVDQYRRRIRAATPVGTLIDELTRTQESPEHSVTRESQLHLALASLPPKYQVVSMLADQLGYRHAEIAHMCGIPEATVRTRLRRAHQALRVALTATEPA